MVKGKAQEEGEGKAQTAGTPSLCCPNCKANLWVNISRYKLVGLAPVLAEELWQCAVCHGQFRVDQMETRAG